MSRIRRLLLLCLIIGLLIIPVPSLAQESGPIYIVQPGDTLSAIARRFGVSQETLVQANNIVNPAQLFPGDALVIPGLPGIEGELTQHTLMLGETLERLAILYSLNPLDLARLNRMMRMDTAYAGQVVLVPLPEDEVVRGESEIILRGETALERAVRANVSPWKGVERDQDSFLRWLLPGRSLIVPGGDGSGIFPTLIGDVNLKPSPLIQGKTAVIRMAGLDGYSVSGSLGKHNLQFFPYNESGLVALQGIHAMADPGLIKFSIEVRTIDSDTTIFGFDQHILLNEGGYGFQFLNGVPPETVDPAYTQPENDLIESVLTPRTETKLWDGALDYPSRYYTEEFISIYGTRRNYNNGALLYYHTGVDFYGQNIPIYAPADGVVVFADALMVRGNATYIDHGWGVYTGYLHQSEMYVEVGDQVERGQVIGQVGATGRVTGPHLHWEIWVGGVPVEPLDWIAEAIP
jgi:murein DD-endopeptidase MepM/ murein hydrolase activator NlpD